MMPMLDTEQLKKLLPNIDAAGLKKASVRQNKRM